MYLPAPVTSPVEEHRSVLGSTVMVITLVQMAIRDGLEIREIVAAEPSKYVPPHVLRFAQ